MAEISPPIPIPRGGFTSNEDESRWLAGTIAMRTQEALYALGIKATAPTDGLYDLLLCGLNAATRRVIDALARQAEESRDDG